MQHPDEGVLHAWLDGELGAGEVAALRAHVDGCAACTALVRQARQLVADSNDLILALDEPAAATGAEGSSAAPAGRGSPVVLLPYHDGAAGRGRRWRAVMAVAATVTVAAGASWLAFRSKAPEVRTASNILSSAPASGAATTAARSTDSQATVSSDSAPVIAPRQDSPAAAAEVATRKPVTPPAVASKAVVTAPAGQAAASSPEFGRARVTEMEPRANLAQGAPPAALRRPVPQQLAEVRAEPATAPAPLLAADGEPIASRIGLDEAREQLGGNLHVIDGLQPEMVGLVPGRLVPGADSSRPVVRVVYLDGDGHSFFLDQQRVTSAPALGAAMARMASVPGSWRAGDVQLRLHGAIPDDSLARLQRRVR